MKKYYCLDCEKEITYQAKRCPSCAKQGKNSSQWKDGRSLKSYYCSCGKPISITTALYRGGRCHSCAQIKVCEIPENNPNYIHGECNRIHYCTICKLNSISYGAWRRGSILCKTCSSQKHGLEMKDTVIGKNNPNYIDGRTPLRNLIRQLEEYFQWRTQIFKRDNYTCQECKTYGGKLNAHHEKSFSIIFNEFLQYYNQFSPIEDKEILVRLAITWKPFWDIDNGKTLCKDCHHKINPRTRIKSQGKED
jgi:hypothetical protein